MKTLIVDDRDDNRYLLESLLKGNGQEVISAANGADALEKLHTQHFDLIISDILMPVMDGFQFCMKVKSEKELGEIPFIFYTATYTGPQDEEFALGIGASRFIRKPCEPNDFMATIEDVLTAANSQKVSCAVESPLPEGEIYKLYSERLVRKLEQKMLESEANTKALQDEKEKFQTLVDELPLGLVLIGFDDSIRYINPRFTEQFGYSLTDSQTLQAVLEKAFPDLQYRQETINHWQQTKKMNGSSVLTPWVVKIKCHNGLEKQVKIRTAILATGDQLVTFEDVSEQIYLEAKLRQSQKMEAIATLAGGIAHDFNNILAAIIGHAEMIELDLSPDSNIAKGISSILQASNRAKQLVGHILTFSRQKEHEQAPLALHIVAKEVLSLMRSTLPATIEIRQSIDREGIVLADSTQMHQVLMNLCTNAFYAMRETGGVLEVILRSRILTTDEAAQIPGLTKGPHLLLTVKDTGCGMLPEVMARIFDPYFTTKPEGEGTGLGLSVTHGIIKNHHGAIEVTSEPDIGTTFHVYLPCVESSAGTSEEQRQVPVPKGNERILLIDDEVSLSKCYRELLQRLGYQAITMNSAIEALEVFRKEPGAFDLVITDLTMPKMTGFQLAEKLLLLRADIPIILCSGAGNAMTEEEVMKKGFQGLIKKPFTIRDIAFSVRQVLDKNKIS